MFDYMTGAGNAALLLIDPRLTHNSLVRFCTGGGRGGGHFNPLPVA